MQLETPRFGGAAFAVVTVVLLGFASACFGVALSSQMASSEVDSGIISVSEATSTMQGGKIRHGVMVERLRRGEMTERVRNTPWVTAAR